MSPQVDFLQFLDWGFPATKSQAAPGTGRRTTEPQACIAPKFFYDTLGSRLFEAITALAEYYRPARRLRFQRAPAAIIRQALGADFTLIDLGCANCDKPGRLFPCGVLLPLCRG